MGFEHLKRLKSRKLFLHYLIGIWNLSIAAVEVITGKLKSPHNMSSTRRLVKYIWGKLRCVKDDEKLKEKCLLLYFCVRKCD